MHHADSQPSATHPPMLHTTPHRCRDSLWMLLFRQTLQGPGFWLVRQPANGGMLGHQQRLCGVGIPK